MHALVVLLQIWMAVRPQCSTFTVLMSYALDNEQGTYMQFLKQKQLLGPVECSAMSNDSSATALFTAQLHSQKAIQSHPMIVQLYIHNTLYMHNKSH